MKLLLANDAKSKLLNRGSVTAGQYTTAGIHFHTGDPGPDGIDNLLAPNAIMGISSSPSPDAQNPGYYYRTLRAYVDSSLTATITHLSVWINKGTSSTEPDMLLAVLDSADYIITNDNMIQATVTLRL